MSKIYFQKCAMINNNYLLFPCINREIVKQLIETPKWPVLMRHTFNDWRKETTPFREMIRKMPGITFMQQWIQQLDNNLRA